VIESYLDICIACGLFLLGSIPADYHYGDYFDAILTWFFLIMIVVVPVFVLAFMCKSKKNFRYAKSMEKKYKLLKKALKKQVIYEQSL
jgi:hypothetical protein